MRRIYLLAEGQTEERFTKTVLTPHLHAFDLHIQPVIVETKRLTSGGKYRGGVTSWGQVERDLRGLLGDRSAVAVTTLIDLYALPGKWPGRPADTGTSAAKATEIEAAMADAIGDRRFVPHLALHEFETFLFAAPDVCGRHADDPELEKTLRRAVAECGGAEAVNDGVDTAPSKRVYRAWPGYAKTTDGPALTEMIGLPRLREACPHFDAWVSRLEGLA